MIEVRRDGDGELCGHVAPGPEGWDALTVFGVVVASHTTRDEATQHVLDHGLALLAERWSYRAAPGDEWQVACIVEARPGSVHLALDYYPMPGVPVVEVTAADLTAGAELRPPGR